MRVGAVTILVSQLLYFLLYLAKKKKTVERYTTHVMNEWPGPQSRGPVPRDTYILSTWVECSPLYIPVSHCTDP